nr:clotting factor B-like isoform X2 [Drosophila takahashii]
MGLELVVVVSLLSLAMGQIRPESSCSNYFQYVNNTAEEIYGEITLPTLKPGHNRIDLVFSQMCDQDDTSVGQLKPYPDEREILWSTGPYKFRIALKQSLSNRKPRLSQLAYNDQLLCGEYALYVSYYTRFYEFSKNESLDRPPSSSSVCGRQGSIAPFVIGGKKFPLGRYPWLSAIFHKDSAPVSGSYKCGGSLISASVVISSAHCVYKMSESSVLIGLGVHDLSNYLEIGANRRNAKRLISHPEFENYFIPDVDIALIIMDRPVTYILGSTKL